MACRIQQYLMERQAREDEEAARKAGKKEVADRIYERLKGQAQAEAAAREEEDRLINLLRAEEEAERARRSEHSPSVGVGYSCCLLMYANGALRRWSQESSSMPSVKDGYHLFCSLAEHRGC